MQKVTKKEDGDDPIKKKLCFDFQILEASQKCMFNFLLLSEWHFDGKVAALKPVLLLLLMLHLPPTTRDAATSIYQIQILTSQFEAKKRVRSIILFTMSNANLNFLYLDKMGWPHVKSRTLNNKIDCVIPTMIILIHNKTTKIWGTLSLKYQSFSVLKFDLIWVKNYLL